MRVATPQDPPAVKAVVGHTGGGVSLGLVLEVEARPGWALPRSPMHLPRASWRVLAMLMAQGEKLGQVSPSQTIDQLGPLHTSPHLTGLPVPGP